MLKVGKATLCARVHTVYTARATVMVNLLVVEHHVTLRLFVHLELKFRSLSLIPLIFSFFVSCF